MEKPQVLLLTHGGWGMSLLNGIQMILGSVDFVHEIPLQPASTLSEYLTAVKEYAVTLPKGSLILTDIFGGTTTNVAVKVGRELGIKVFTGLNAPLLLSACSQIQFSEVLDMNEVIESGKDSIKDAIEEVLKSLQKKGGEQNG